MENYIDYAVELIIQYAPKVLGALITLIIGFWLAKLISNRLKKGWKIKELILH